MKNAFMTQRTQTAMSVHNLNLLPNTNIPQNRKKREDSRKRGLAIDDEEGYVVDFESVCEVADAFAVIMGVGDDDDLVAAVYQFG